VFGSAAEQGRLFGRPRGMRLVLKPPEHCRAVGNVGSFLGALRNPGVAKREVLEVREPLICRGQPVSLLPPEEDAFERLICATSA